MYRISTKVRQYSPTPIVKVDYDNNGKEIETIVLIPTGKKKDGDALAEKIVKFLNESESWKTQKIKQI